MSNDAQCVICQGETDPDQTCTQCHMAVCENHRIGCDSCWDMFCSNCGRTTSDGVEYCNYHFEQYAD